MWDVPEKGRRKSPVVPALTIETSSSTPIGAQNHLVTASPVSFTLQGSTLEVSCEGVSPLQAGAASGRAPSQGTVPACRDQCQVCILTPWSGGVCALRLISVQT